MTGLGRVPVAYGRIITCEARSGISQPLLHFPDALLLLNGGSRAMCTDRRCCRDARCRGPAAGGRPQSRQDGACVVSVGTDDRVEMGGTEASLGHKQKAATASGECSWAAARQWRWQCSRRGSSRSC